MDVSASASSSPSPSPSIPPAPPSSPVTTEPTLTREQQREKYKATMKERRDARRSARCGGPPRGPSRGSGGGSGSGAAAGAAVDIKAKVAQLVHTMCADFENGKIAPPPEFQAVAEDMDGGVSLEALKTLCARRGANPRFVPIIAAAMQRVQDGSATLEDATSTAVEECMAVMLAAAR